MELRMTAEVIETITTRELHGVKFGMDTKDAQGQTADEKQGDIDAYGTGAFGLDSNARMQALYDLVLQIRATLVANGMMKGGA